ncbi:MAG: 4Fe-4S dicluster domain-containing protein [Caldilineae bacterium]|nr:MAG: 4Fe-4S dicluster domain-containing protein [Caldilineae bacterium]
MPRWGMVIDLDKCTACQACTVACRAENNVSFAGLNGYRRGRAIFWNTVIGRVEGEFPEVQGIFIPMPCMHCDHPPCVKVCPVGATYQDEEGRVLQRYERCIGCRMCMQACPYNRRYFNWRVQEWPDTFALYRNPDPETQPRPKGVVEKCTFCVQRLRKAREEGRPIGSDYPDGVVPACVETCTGGARYFGDLDDPESIVSRLARSPRAFRLQEELGTEPKVYYLRPGQWEPET